MGYRFRFYTLLCFAILLTVGHGPHELIEMLLGLLIILLFLFCCVGSKQLKTHFHSGGQWGGRMGRYEEAVVMVQLLLASRRYSKILNE